MIHCSMQHVTCVVVIASIWGKVWAAPLKCASPLWCPGSKVNFLANLREIITFQNWELLSHPVKVCISIILHLNICILLYLCYSVLVFVFYCTCICVIFGQVTKVNFLANLKIERSSRLLFAATAFVGNWSPILCQGLQQEIISHMNEMAGQAIFFIRKSTLAKFAYMCY